MSTVDLKPFCVRIDPRHYLHHLIPLKNGHCACDGFIFVVSDSPVPEPSTAPIELGRFDPEKAAERTRRGVAEAEYMHPVRDVKYVKSDCKTCKGTGFCTYEECEWCNGEGEFTHGTHEYECKDCDGTGKIVYICGSDCCPDCKGTGLALAASAIQFTGANGDRLGANPVYIALINKHLPNAKITITGDSKGTLFGTFDGGMFMLMSAFLGQLNDVLPPITLTQNGGVIHG